MRIVLVTPEITHLFGTAVPTAASQLHWTSADWALRSLRGTGFSLYRYARLTNCVPHSYPVLLPQLATSGPCMPGTAPFESAEQSSMSCKRLAKLERW